MLSGCFVAQVGGAGGGESHGTVSVERKQDPSDVFTQKCSGRSSHRTSPSIGPEMMDAIDDAAAANNGQRANGDDPSPSSLLRTVIIGTAGVASALLVLSVQMGVPPYVMVAGLLCAAVCVASLHKCYPGGSKDPPHSNGLGLTPLDVSQFLAPNAALFARSYLLSLLVINVIWGMRWLIGVETVCTDAYGLNRSQVAALLECGREHQWITLRSKCHVLSSFLFNEWPLYTHVTGATICLSLGPFQLSKEFRQLNLPRHRKLGYVYAGAMTVAVVGAVRLVAQTTSGVAAGSAFVILGMMWCVTLARGIASARARQLEVHREWMIRNYCLTFAAVPFRFLPGVLAAFGAPPEYSYAGGAYLSVALMSAVAEGCVRHTSRGSQAASNLTASLTSMPMPS